MTLRKREDTGH